MAKGNKTGGRKEGTPNKATIEMRSILKTALSEQIKELPKLIEGLSPKEKADIIIKLLPYIVPKLNPIEESMQVENEMICTRDEVNNSFVLSALIIYKDITKAAFSIGFTPAELIEYIDSDEKLFMICANRNLPPYDKN
jgi:hypothetical protein